MSEEGSGGGGGKSESVKSISEGARGGRSFIEVVSEDGEEVEGWRVGVVVGVVKLFSGPDEQIDTISTSENVLVNTIRV